MRALHQADASQAAACPSPHGSLAESRRVPAQMRFVFVLLVLIVLVTASAYFAPPAAALKRDITYGECVASVIDAAGDNRPAVRALISAEKVRRGAETFCRAAQSWGVFDAKTDADGRRRLIEFMRENPDAIRGWCLPIAYSARGTLSSAVARDITRAEWKTYASEMCSAYPTYLRDDGSVDYAGLGRDRATAFAPFCAAGILTTFHASHWRVARSRVKEVARAACKEMLLRGVIVYRGGSNFTYDRSNPAYGAIVRKFFAPIAR